ncbi:expressed unknown protein [Seminavis robusta]|uniref:EF-hand domain-containing protein n=1 Tax=Seminavis robusta TaxID=568900 RepID=A0A9N8DSK2_9STRA|nr:expressed unknown protein [Seminavis robusta]|eukprot:Sro321_g116870.1 n/a (230) ;mRNA; f:70072-70918
MVFVARTGAARAGAARRQAEGGAKERHNLLSKRREALRGRAEEVFCDMGLPVHGEEDWLLEDDIYDYLEEVLNIEAEKIQPEAVSLLLDTAQRHMKQKEGWVFDDKDEPALSRDALIDAVVKYGEFIKRFEQKGEEDVFKKYDKQDDGNLSRRELRHMLQDYERKATRSKNGLVITFMIYETDLDWIIAQVDEDGNGEIGRGEFLPAIAAWEELAEARLQQPHSCCVIL